MCALYYTGMYERRTEREPSVVLFCSARQYWLLQMQRHRVGMYLQTMIIDQNPPDGEASASDRCMQYLVHMRHGIDQGAEIISDLNATLKLCTSLSVSPLIDYLCLWTPNSKTRDRNLVSSGTMWRPDPVKAFTCLNHETNRCDTRVQSKKHRRLLISSLQGLSNLITVDDERTYTNNCFTSLSQWNGANVFAVYSSLPPHSCVHVNLWQRKRTRK